MMSVGSLKPGKLVVIDDEPCRIIEITKSKAGKHGAAKARIVAVSLFTGNKKNLLKSMVIKKNGRFCYHT